MEATPRIDRIDVRLAAWWARRSMPLTAKVLRRLGAWENERWRNGGLRECRGVWHGYRMRLDSRDYHQRGAWFYGRLLDVHVQLAMRALLRPGDFFVDAGANIGMLTMLAARLVGPAGRVVAVEPNPVVFDELRWHVTENVLDMVQLHCVALSDHNGSMRLTLPPTGNTGAATLGRLPSRHGGREGGHYEVPVRRGDELLAGIGAPSLIKLDVEGHETAALRGLARTLESARPAIVAEVNNEMLPANGTSVEELFGLLQESGYEAFGLTIDWRRWARRWDLGLLPVTRSWRPSRTENVLFLHNDDERAGELARRLKAPSRT